MELTRISEIMEALLEIHEDKTIDRLQHPEVYTEGEGFLVRYLLTHLATNQTLQCMAKAYIQEVNGG